MTVFRSGRGLGITDALHAFAEWPVIVLFGLLTQLGDGWFLFLLAGGLYVAGDALPGRGIDRPRGLFLFGLVLAYFALIEVLKNAFRLPRPPGAGDPLSVEWLPAVLGAALGGATTAEGYGFPSGHALGSTMVWGGLALVLDRGSLRTRIGAAGVVVAVVSLSRLVLGVHYAVDVVVGVAVGAVVLGALYRVSDAGSRPERVFAVAAAVGAVGLLTDVSFHTVAVTGGAIGGWIAWRGVADATPPRSANRRELLAAFSVLGAVGGLFGVVAAAEPPLALAFLGTAVAVGGVVVAPLVSARLTA